MKWLNSNANKTKKLTTLFSNLGIDFSYPAFCDSDEFLNQERKDSTFLEYYALYVEHKDYSDQYLNEAKRKIEICSTIFHEILKADGRMGACVDASSIFARMLDELGVWNYVTKSTVKIEFPEKSGFGPEYFWLPTDERIFAGHSIVVAPPFGVIDLTIKNQEYIDGKGDLLPEKIVSSSFSLGNWTPEDILSPEVRMMMKMQRIEPLKHIKLYDSAMFNVLNTFPCRVVEEKGCTFKFITVAVGGSVFKLKDIDNYKPTGRLAIDIFEKDILPHI